MLLGSQEGLADTIPSGDRSQGEVSFGTSPSRFVVPCVLGKKLASEAARECELQRVGLADFQSIKRTGHGIEQIRQEDPIKPVPAIRGQHKIEFFCVNGPQEGCEPFRS